MKIAKTMANTITMVVELTSSVRVGHMTLVNSVRTSTKKVVTFSHIPRSPDSTTCSGKNQAWQDSNLQPLVLETSALPIELQT